MQQSISSYLPPIPSPSIHYSHTVSCFLFSLPTKFNLCCLCCPYSHYCEATHWRWLIYQGLRPLKNSLCLSLTLALLSKVNQMSTVVLSHQEDTVYPLYSQTHGSYNALITSSPLVLSLGEWDTQIQRCHSCLNTSQTLTALVNFCTECPSIPQRSLSDKVWELWISINHLQICE